MTSHELTIQIARAEGVMMALYGICRDLAIGCSVEEDKNGKLGDVVGDAMQGLVAVYQALGEEPGFSVHVTDGQTVMNCGDAE